LALGWLFPAGACTQSKVDAALERTSPVVHPITLTDSSGAEIALSTPHSRPVLAHLFATCREELPALNRLSERTQGTLAVLAISVVKSGIRVSRFLGSLPVKVSVLLDPERKTAKAWNVSILPTTFVLDKDLRARLAAEGGFNWAGIDPAQLEDMLASPSTAASSSGG
jgi:hypothetical protein